MSEREPRRCAYCHGPIGPKRAPWAKTCCERCSRARGKEQHAERQRRYRLRQAAMYPEDKFVGPLTLRAHEAQQRYWHARRALEETDSESLFELFWDEMRAADSEFGDETDYPVDPVEAAGLPGAGERDDGYVRLVKLWRVAEMVGKSRRTVQRKTAEGTFPTQATGYRGYWYVDDIYLYMAGKWTGDERV